MLRATPEIDVTLYAVNDFYARPNYIDAVRPLAATRGKNSPKTFDAGVVLGDRYEMLLAAAQLVEARVPLVHIHGGEHTYGSLDERWRYAITAIAGVHCVAHAAAAHELLPHYASYITGAPGLDDITERQLYPHDHAENEILVLYNPAIDADVTRREWDAIADAVSGQTLNYFWIRPNGDRFSELIGATAKNSMSDLDSSPFRDLLAHVRVIVGNSSAGIIEAPSLGTWAVNVGDRQRGRVRAGNVIDVPAEPQAIRNAIADALSRPRFVGVNPYNVDGKACERIRDVLLGMVAT